MTKEEMEKLKKENEKMKKIINSIEKAYRNTGADLEETLDKYFYGGKSPIRK